MWNRDAIAAVARRPGLWLEAVRAAWSMAPRGWWRRPPFLPLPDPAYVSWRTATAYGSSGAVIVPEDLVSYLRWRKRQRHRRGRP